MSFFVIFELYDGGSDEGLSVYLFARAGISMNPVMVMVAFIRGLVLLKDWRVVRSEAVRE